MSPDFEYFLRGRPVSTISHTAIGILIFCLPVGFLVHLAFERVCRGALLAVQHKYVRERIAPVSKPRFFAVIVSLLIGAVTHVLWDGFTHAGGTFVLLLPVLGQPVAGVPVYRVLQHASTILGFVAIGCFTTVALRRAETRPAPSASFHWSVVFWSLLVAWIALAGLRPLLSALPFAQAVGRGVVQAISAGALAVFVYSVVFQLRAPRG